MKRLDKDNERIKKRVTVVEIECVRWKRLSVEDKDERVEEHKHP